mgnify:CR=1 FL=1
MRLLKTLIILVGILLQAIVAMVFLEGHRALSTEPMEWWYPWLAYTIGGFAAWVLWLIGSRKVDKMFKRSKS